MKELYYQHLENVCKIQDDYIFKKINGKKLKEKIEEENARYLIDLKQANQNLKYKISIERALSVLKDKGENK